MRNFELASRLAGFLWRSVPNDHLLELADRDTPISNAELTDEVCRMLTDERADRFVEDFTSSWIGYNKLDQIAIHPNYYQWWNPKFKDYITVRRLKLSEFVGVRLHCRERHDGEVL
ncbi:MAG: DUF1592 domain-containing protein [Verrucomicrobiota bacterium]